MAKNREIPTDLLVKHGINTLHDILVSVQRQTDVAFEQLRGASQKDALEEVETAKIDNITRRIDRIAEFAAEHRLKRLLSNSPHRWSLDVWGEEKLGEKRYEHLDLRSTENTVALFDMVDGTDLVNRGIPAWCAAAVFFYPPTKKILAAIVGTPNREFYVATAEGEAFKLIIHSEALQIPGPQRFTKSPLRVGETTLPLERSVVAFYGQKAENLLSIFASKFGEHEKTLGRSKFGEFLAEIHAVKPSFRIQTLGGNPMMVKLAEGKMDAVFELLGQKAHDVVPGAFICRQAGAVVRDMEGNDLDLASALMTPNKGGTRYIIARSEKLWRELWERLR